MCCSRFPGLRYVPRSAVRSQNRQKCVPIDHRGDRGSTAVSGQHADGTLVRTVQDIRLHHEHGTSCDRTPIPSMPAARCDPGRASSSASACARQVSFAMQSAHTCAAAAAWLAAVRQYLASQVCSCIEQCCTGQMSNDGKYAVVDQGTHLDTLTECRLHDLVFDSRSLIMRTQSDG